MACTAILQGNEIDCLDSVGGVKEIYVTEFTNVPQANITSSSGTISSMSCSSGNKFYTLQLKKNTAQADLETISNDDNGTQYEQQTVTFNLFKMSASKRYTVKSIVKNRVMVIVKDRNDVIWLLGQTTGLNASSTIGTTGKAFGDMNGYTISLTGMEPDNASTMSQAILDTLLV